MKHNYPEVSIDATDDTLEVTVVTGEGEEDVEKFSWSHPGMISGCELRDVLAACGIQADYTYEEDEQA